MRAVVLAVVLLAACGGVAGPFPASRARSPANLEIEMAGAEQAVSIARAEWARRLAVKLPEAPRVRWFAGDPLAYKGQDDRAWVHSIYWPHANEAQITATPGGKRTPPPSGTDLAHELLHWALHHATGDGDAGHSLPIWDEEGAVNAALQERGL
jgi:hypothetical protein